MNRLLRLTKIQIILILLLIIVLLVLFLYFLTHSQFIKEEAPPQGTPPSLTVKNLVEQKLNPQIQITSEQYTFPDKLPYLSSQTKAFSESEAKGIASKFGLSSEPKKLTDYIDGVVYVWIDKKYSLELRSNSRQLAYSANSDSGSKQLIASAVNKHLSDKDYQIAAEKFLTEKVGLSGETFKFVNFVYYATEEGKEMFVQTSQESAKIIQVNYTFSGTDYPIYNVVPRNTQFNLRFLLNGEILSADAELTNLSKSPVELRLKNYDEFVKSIDQIVLVSLDDGNVNLPDLKDGDIKNLVVNQIQLVYLLDNPTGSYLLPAFLLKGTATVAGNSKKVNAAYYLPAYSDQQ